VLSLSASVEKSSEHPLAEAIVNGAKNKSLELFDAQNFNAIPGHGIQVDINDQKVFIGNKKLMHKNSIVIDTALNRMEKFILSRFDPNQQHPSSIDKPSCFMASSPQNSPANLSRRK